jgi:hypothetical protein|tara:strand:- start:3908 stop:4561 length:654 start_codon:yes stop_codon:yes gene_type:complete
MPIDYDEAPEGATMTEAPPTARKIIRSGWGAVDSIKQEDSNYAVRLKTGPDPIIIKFLEDAPYASWRQHWVTRPGQKSFVCRDGMDSKGCPLCDSGNRPRPLFAFNVILLERGEEPAMRSYEAGTRVIATLRNFNDDERQGPLSKHYWAVSRSGTGPQTQYNHLLIKERDLKEEWSVSPLSDESLEALASKVYDSDIIRVNTFDELSAIATEDLGAG